MTNTESSTSIDQDLPLTEQLRTGNLFASPCPSRDVLKHVCSRWGVLILISLRDGTHRFSELRKRIGGVSEKMLAQSLQALEQDGFIERIAYPVVPPHVEYSLTTSGEEIARLVATLADWIEVNMSQITAAQQQHQSRQITTDESSR
ncbi:MULTISPECIES: helix-turn-helix domain-containing protein [unclassified Oceanobacter]|uniref:winged helix-turn-helix transcriptional regulator n=1 Tax=unclassified Oceanobacter TaxID=2620260 RepID=UPI002735F104|nr:MULTISPECIES: helix-turn-helix domain-containing protein [unclassified Oceanobacter]MDP2610407.1 helix-turn-helix domain-containing protein [Oceanobacter sp. 1_MG-2023]MDP2613643.1 helix-turn-helix domain-containing protein [Oceanobacter sp. 2_MG-2023]